MRIVQTKGLALATSLRQKENPINQRITIICFLVSEWFPLNHKAHALDNNRYHHKEAHDLRHICFSFRFTLSNSFTGGLRACQSAEAGIVSLWSGIDQVPPYEHLKGGGQAVRQFSPCNGADEL